MDQVASAIRRLTLNTPKVRSLVGEVNLSAHQETTGIQLFSKPLPPKKAHHRANNCTPRPNP
jgi:hypothetical protein